MLNLLMQVFDQELYKHLSSLGIKISCSLSEQLASQQFSKPQLKDFVYVNNPKSQNLSNYHGTFLICSYSKYQNTHGQLLSPV